MVYSSHGIDTNRCASRLHAMIRHTPDALCTKWIEREPLEQWSDETGRLVLMGDAAHPAMVCNPLVNCTTYPILLLPARKHT